MREHGRSAVLGTLRGLVGWAWMLVGMVGGYSSFKSGFGGLKHRDHCSVVNVWV
jgi:hypothetical protein